MLPAASSCKERDTETAFSGIIRPQFTWRLWFALSVERCMPSEAGGTELGFFGLHYGNLET